MATKRTSASKARRPPAQPIQIYDLHVELLDVTPAIWRRLLVPDWMTLDQFHHILQFAMGWTNSHLHRFVIGGMQYGIPEDEWPELDFTDDRLVTLRSCLGTSIREFGYEYDFGDGWMHSVEVKGVGPADKLHRYPACIGGANACPPEDVGGPPGYAAFLEAIRDSSHPDHEELLGWCGGVFDPQGFGISGVNTLLWQMSFPRKR